MKWSVFLYTFLLVTSIYSCQRDIMPPQQEDFPRLVPVIHQYGSEAPQFGQLRMPERDGKVPVIMIIHGGCWVSFYDLGLMEKMADSLTREGYATWNIEYRRIGDQGGGWPGTFNDVARALKHLETLALTYPLDLDNILVTGHSAGGHLALYLGSESKLSPQSELKSDGLPRIKGIVSLAGITDLEDYYQPMGCGSNVIGLTGGSASEYPERYFDGSPINHLPLNVPQILVHGQGDFIVPLSHVTPYYEKAKAEGETIELIDINGAGHFELINPGSTAWNSVTGAFSRLLN